MLNKLFCWLSGFSCRWKTQHTAEYVRSAYGIFVGVNPPRVHVLVHYQMCERCGKTKCHEQVLHHKS